MPNVATCSSLVLLSPGEYFQGFAGTIEPLKENLAFVSLVRTLTAPILAKAGSTSMRVSDAEQCNQSTKGGRHIVLNAIARPCWYLSNCHNQKRRGKSLVNTNHF